ncbi:hypothetical protein [Lacticaseibacillus sharpeae]|nr:hypothetical protein [Lacticaseibacillus sharpeae]
MSKYEIVLPGPNQEVLDVTDPKLYTYDLSSDPLKGLQVASANQGLQRLSRALHSSIANTELINQLATGNKTEYIANFSEETRQKLASGEWRLGVRKDSQQMYGMLIDSATKRTKAIADLEPIVVQNLGTLPVLAAIQGQLSEIANKIANLTTAVQRVEQGQYNDRFAGVFSARQLLIEGLAATNVGIKTNLLTKSVMISSEAASELMMALRTDSVELIKKKDNGPETARLESLVRQSLTYLNTAVQIKLAAYTALGEEPALIATLSGYQTFLKQSLLTTGTVGEHSVAWLIDNGHHGKNDNPIFELTSRVAESSAELIEQVRQDRIGETEHERIE